MNGLIWKSAAPLAVFFAVYGVVTACGAAETPTAPIKFKTPSVTELSPYKPVGVVAGAPGAHPLAVAAASDRTITTDALAKAQAYSDAHSGRALLIWQGGELRYERYAPGFDADTRFETYSMHKSVLGLVYGAAIRDKVIHSLDDPASRYLPEWRGDERGAITLRQLLSMQSGLHVYSLSRNGKPDPEALALAFGDKVTATALGSPLQFAPGTRFDYNNASSQIAGAILNRALKKAGRGDYATYVSQVLLKPLGAGDAHLWLEKEGGDPRYYAYFEVRARDWLRIGIMIDRTGRFDGNQVLPAAWIKEISTPSSTNPNYGLQVWIGSPWKRWRAYGPDNPLKMSHQAPYLVDDLVYFDGFGGERVYVSPSRDLVIVRIGESDLAFDDSILPNTIIAGLKPAVPAP